MARPACRWMGRSRQIGPGKIRKRGTLAHDSYALEKASCGILASTQGNGLTQGSRAYASLPGEHVSFKPSGLQSEAGCICLRLQERVTGFPGLRAGRANPRILA